MEQRISREQFLEVIRSFIISHGYPPTSREIAAETGYSLSTVNVHLKRMIKEGSLETDHPFGSPRAIRVPGMKWQEEQDG